MTQSIPITKSALKKQASLMRSYERLLTLELDGKEPEEFYELVFSRLVKPDPFRLFEMGLGLEAPFMLGTDQRDQIVPRLAERLMPLRPGALVMDVGSGDGQTTAYALEGRLQPLSFLPLDTAEGALERYRDLFASRFPNVTVSRSIAAGIDQMVTAEAGSAAAVEERLDMVIVIHAIYFTADIARFLGHIHERLLPGGKMLIAFGEKSGRYSSRLAEEYWAENDRSTELQDHQLGNVIETFFGIETAGKTADADRGACEEVLNQRLGGSLFRVAEVIRQPTRLFAHDLGDLLATPFLTGLMPRDSEELRRQVAFVSARLQDEPEAYDLQLTLSGPRARMLSVAQPQILIGLEKL